MLTLNSTQISPPRQKNFPNVTPPLPRWIHQKSVGPPSNNKLSSLNAGGQDNSISSRPSFWEIAPSARPVYSYGSHKINSIRMFPLRSRWILADRYFRFKCRAIARMMKIWLRSPLNTNLFQMIFRQMFLVTIILLSELKQVAATPLAIQKMPPSMTIQSHFFHTSSRIKTKKLACNFGTPRVKSSIARS